MPAFNGTLRANEIFAALYNMIISQQVFADNISGTNAQIVDKARVDGGLFGDTKIYYATDALKSAPWGNDAEAINLLALHRPPAPSQQAIYLDKFRQISLTVDDYLSKRAWTDEGTFSSFNSVMMGWIGDTKKIYDSTTYNAFFGTNVTSTGKQNLDVALSDITATGEEKNRLEAQMIAQTIADLLVDLTDTTRDYNDYGYLRSYNESDIKIVWNAKWLNKITKLDLPTIFHKDMMDKFDTKLPARFFGEVNTTAGTTASSNTTVRSLIEKDYGTTHLFAGDLLPNSTAYLANETYTEDADVICKVYVKEPPFMSSFEVGTSFYNPKSLTENHYLTWGHNSLEHLKNYPFITVNAD